MEQKTTQKRAVIRAPKVEHGNQFKPIDDYWFTTYRQLNPFMGVPRCRECGREALFERYVGMMDNAPVVIHEFACPNGHVWRHEETKD